MVPGHGARVLRLDAHITLNETKMRFLTRKWQAAETDAEHYGPIAKYKAYITSVADSMPGDLRRLKGQELHDSQVISVRVCRDALALELAGYRHPWSALRCTPASIFLTYSGVPEAQRVARKLRLRKGWDILFQEIEVLGKGTFEHRLLFGGHREVAICFRVIKVTYRKREEGCAQHAAGTYGS